MPAKKRRTLPRRKLRSRPKRVAAALDQAVDVAQVFTKLMPATSHVLQVAFEAAARTINQAAIEELAKTDGNLAAQLIALLSKKRPP